MLRFKDFILESNNTNNMLYAVAPQNFMSGDSVGADFDVSSSGSWDPDEKKNMVPWQIENSMISARRRQEIMMWLQAAGANSKKAVANKSIPLPPYWQGGWMK